MNFKRTIKNFKKAARLLALLLLPLAGAHAQTLKTGRHGNTATLLPNGNFLVTGGVMGNGNSLVVSTASVEIFFTSAAAWGIGAPLLTIRSSHTATLMSDGRVLVAGGFNAAGTPLSSAEVYDPSAGASGSWTVIPDAMDDPRGAHTATLLNKGNDRGKVLICGGQVLANPAQVGGQTANCELYTPRVPVNTGTFDPTLPMNSARMGHTASGITNGKVFVSGGMQWNAGAWVYLPTNEMYDSVSPAWTPGPPLNDGRADHTATVLNNGNILILGGYNASNKFSPEELPDSVPPVPANQDAGSKGFLGSAEMFNPEGGREMIMGGDYGVMPYRLARHSSVLSPEGKQITMGGYGNILPTLYSGPSILTDTSYSSMSATSNTTANLLPSSVMSLEVKQMLSRTVNGRIVDGDLFLISPLLVADPEIAASNVKIWMVDETTATLDGSPVGHEIPRIPVPDPGQFWDDVMLKAPGGAAVFTPQELAADIPAQNYVIFSSIAFSPIISLDGPVAWNSTVSSITFNASFQVPGIYVGGRLSGIAEIINGAVTVEGQYVLTLQYGTARITNALVAADGTAGRINVVLNIGGPAVPVSERLIGTVTNIYPDTTTVLSGPLNAAGRSIDPGLIMKLSYTSDRIDLSGLTYTHEPSNMIIREMIFSDQLAFTPNTAKWKFNSESMGMPLYSFTSMVTPAADFLFMGGRNCGTASIGQPYSDCIRTRPAPSISSPTFTALSYYNAYVGEFEGTWPSSFLLAGKRAFHTSTVLPDSSILTCGGSNGAATLRSCELLSPNYNAWVQVSSMNASRALHTATLLPNGAVLVAGGTTGSSTAVVKTAELFFPDTQRWVPVQSMAFARQNHTANLLPNGDVLVTGGGDLGSYRQDAEIYKTTAAVWETVGTNMSVRRSNHVSVNMKDGNILVIGGINGSGASTSVDRYNYATKTWTAMNPLATPRYNHAANLLRDGRVLVSGGSDNTGSLMTTEIFSGGANWGYGWPMKFPRANHRSLLLPNGKIMVTGGELGGVVYNSAEGYDPDLDWWSEQGYMASRAHHTTVLTQNNRIMNIGGASGQLNHLDTTETIYFSYEPDQAGLDPKNRNPLISTGTATLDRNDNLTLFSSSANFHGLTEASGGGAGHGNASFSNPRVYLQAVDIPTGFMVDITTRLYSLYGGVNTNWETTLSSVTVRIPLNPGELPYGYYHARVASNGQFSPGLLTQVTVPRPTGVVSVPVGTVLSSTSIRWDWTQNTLCNPTGLCEGYAILSSSNNVLISTATFPVPASYVQSGLTPNTEIAVKIGGYNTGGYSTPLQESGTYYTFAVEPVLTLEYASFETAKLSWDPVGNSPLTIYEVTMSKSPTFLPAGEVLTPVSFTENHTTTSAVVSALLPNQSYSFRVRAKSGRLGSGVPTAGYSNVVTTITVSNVTNLAGSPRTMSEINWTWDTAVGAPPYEVYDITAGTGPLAVFLTSTTLTSYLQTSLSTNTAHAVGVNAYSGSNKGPAAYSPSIYTLAVPPLPGVPQVFTNITTGSFTLNWLADGNPPDTTYYAAISIYSDLRGAVIFPVVSMTSVTVTAGDGVTPNTLYYAAVSARNGDNVGTSSAALGGEYTLAEAPSGLAALGISMSGISLGWGKGANPDDTTYEIRGSTTLSDLSTTTPKNLLTYIPFSAYHTSNSAGIGGLLTSTSYYFDVAAYIRTTTKPPGPTARTQTNVAVLTLPGPGGAPAGSIGGTSDPSRDSTIYGILPNGTTVALHIPAGAFASVTAIAISSSAVNSCSQTAIPLVAVEIWTDNDAQPQVPVTLTLNYNDTAAATITPNISKLVMARYNPVSGDCLPLDTKVDPGPRSITARLNHFSRFQLMIRSVPTDLSGVRIYPNPFYANRGQGFVTINNVPAGTEAVIYTLSGDKVWEGTAGSAGMMTWDATNSSGVLVASGIYLAALDSSGGKKVFKIAVER